MHLTGRPFPKEAEILLQHWFMKKNGWCSTCCEAGKFRCKNSKGTDERRHQDMQCAVHQYGQFCSMHSPGWTVHPPCNEKLQRRKVLPPSLPGTAEKIETSKTYTDKDNVTQPNRKYYMHLKHLNEHYAHQASKEIIEFCKKNQAGIIVLPEYEENFPGYPCTEAEIIRRST